MTSRHVAPSARAVMRKASGENFPVALVVLPPATRRHLRAIYGFARLVDDAGDDVRSDRRGLLDAIERDLDRIYEGEPQNPLMRRLASTVRELRLPREPFRRLIEANRQDQRVARYETFDALTAYCDLSANPVGRLVLHVFGTPTPERVAWSDAVCTGLQLVEHLQDVGEDLRLRGRIYLPGEDMRRFGVAERDLERSRPTVGLRDLVAFELERARRLLGAGGPLVASLSGRPRLAVAGYVGGGIAAAKAIERAGYDVLGEPPRPPAKEKVRWTFRVLREAR